MAAARGRASHYAKAYTHGNYGTYGSSALDSHAPPVYHATTRRVIYKPQKAVGIKQALPMVLVIGVLLFVLGFAALLQYAQLTSTAKKISALDVELAQLQQLGEALEVRIAEADDPSRIRSVAVNRLGMVQPTEDQIRFVNMPDIFPSTQLTEVPPPREGILNTLLRFLD